MSLANSKKPATEIVTAELRNALEYLDTKDKELHEREDALKIREDRMKSIQSDWKDPIVFDVGGRIHKTTKATLMKAGEGSIFVDMLTDAGVNPSNEPVFIDRDGMIFSDVLNYLRTGKLILSPYTTYLSLREEAEYFGCRTLLQAMTSFRGGDLLNDEHQRLLTKWTRSEGTSWKLVHKSSVDGFGAGVFHQNCDNIGPTIVVVKSQNGYLFGGYTCVPWNCSQAYSAWDSQCFIFTLTNPHNIAPTMYPNISAYSIYCNSNYGATFGASDIYVCNNANSSNGSVSNFPNSYRDTTGKGNTTFTGGQNFRVLDLEVYAKAIN